MSLIVRLLSYFIFFLYLSSCNTKTEIHKIENEKLRVILDTDANNELDDQHAMAYLLMNGDYFNHNSRSNSLSRTLSITDAMVIS